MTTSPERHKNLSIFSGVALSLKLSAKTDVITNVITKQTVTFKHKKY